MTTKDEIRRFIELVSEKTAFDEDGQVVDLPNSFHLFSPPNIRYRF